jgi:thiol-disulfide isomerase/thioredoxin
VSYLIAAVALALALTLLNLLLTLGIIRRLREMRDGDAAGPGILGQGRTPADFAAIDTDGREVTRTQLSGTVLVGFFATTCSACLTELPRFVARAGDAPGGRDHVLAVVQGDGPAAQDMTRQLTGAGRVVVEGPNGPIAGAFEVKAFPAWCLLDNGTVRDSGIGASPVASAAMA